MADDSNYSVADMTAILKSARSRNRDGIYPTFTGRAFVRGNMAAVEGKLSRGDAREAYVLLSINDGPVTVEWVPMSSHWTYGEAVAYVRENSIGVSTGLGQSPSEGPVVEKRVAIDARLAPPGTIDARVQEIVGARGVGASALSDIEKRVAYIEAMGTATGKDLAFLLNLIRHPAAAQTVSVPVPDGVEVRVVEQLLRDALWDFVRIRRDPRAYVAVRYPVGNGGPFDEPEHRARKIAEVAGRVALAEQLSEPVGAEAVAPLANVPDTGFWVGGPSESVAVPVPEVVARPTRPVPPKPSNVSEEDWQRRLARRGDCPRCRVYTEWDSIGFKNPTNSDFAGLPAHSGCAVAREEAQ